MKAHESLVRLRKFEVDESRRKVAGLEEMISEFKDMADDLDRQIKIEQQRAGVSDVNDCRYPLWAKDAIVRRQHLLESVRELEEQLEAARDHLAASFEELKKVEKIAERNRQRQRQEAERKELEELEEIAMARR